MTELILLVVAAAWLAVLIPPMLRSRVENRPNSSVTDFRRQLTKLQDTATPARGAMRSMGRPLAQSPLSRPAAPGRPGQPVLRSGVTRQPSKSELAARATMAAAPAQAVEPAVDAPRYRTHGDPTGGQRRPVSRDQRRERHERTDGPGAYRRPRPNHDDPRVADRRAPHGGRRSHGDPTGERRRPAAPPRARSARQRRSNVMFMLVIAVACTLFLTITTSSTVMLYVFVLSILALGGFVYMLAQSRPRSSGAAYGEWRT